MDQITEMAAVMRRAVEIDEKHGCKDQERIIQLEVSMKSNSNGRNSLRAKIMTVISIELLYLLQVTESVTDSAVLLQFPCWPSARTVFPPKAYSQVLHR